MPLSDFSVQLTVAVSAAFAYDANLLCEPLTIWTCSSQRMTKDVYSLEKQFSKPLNHMWAPFILH